MTFHDMKWRWCHREGSLVATFRFRVSILHVTFCLRVLSMVFVQNRRFSIFSHRLDIHFIDTVTCINRWKFQGNHSVGVDLTSIPTFMRWGHLTCDLTLRDLDLKVSPTHAEKMYDKVCQKRRRCAPPFSGNLEKKTEVVLNPPSRRRLNVK